MGHEDRLDEIRVSIIEGRYLVRNIAGYSVHICADPDALAAHATLDDFVVDPRVSPSLGNGIATTPCGRAATAGEVQGGVRKAQRVLARARDSPR
jgi:hypothetical protein